MWTTDLSSSRLRPPVTQQLHWRLCFKLTFTAPPSCWNRWDLLSSSASSWITKPQPKSGRSEDPTLLEVSPPFSPGPDHGQPSPPSTRTRPEQYRWHWISSAVFICPPATSQLTCSTCFIFRRSQPERTFKCRLSLFFDVLLCVSLLSFRSFSGPGPARFGFCFRVFFFFLLVSGVFDSCVDHGARSLVQEVLAFSPISESGRHARAHDSTSPPYDPERCGHDAAHPGDLESG